jgi:hypothetical protein
MAIARPVMRWRDQMMEFLQNWMQKQGTSIQEKYLVKVTEEYLYW